MQLFACVIILFICAVFFGLWHSLYTLSTWILPPFLSVILTFCIFYYAILELSRRFTFPGSTWLWRRNIENHYQKTFVLKIRKKILLLKSLVQYIDEGNPMWKDLIPILERREIAKTLNLVLSLFGKQVMHKTLTNRQKVMMEQFNQLERALQFTRLFGKTSGKTITVWEFLVDEKNQAESLEPSLNFVFEDKTKSGYLLEQCKALDFRLHDIICEKSGYQGLKRWLFENTFGTVDHVREELDNRYKCQHISLKVSGNNTIDCVLALDRVKEAVPSSAPASRDIEDIEMTPIVRDNSKRTQASSIKTKSMGPTIIMCCPNAGYYEYTCYESQWLDLYLSLGFNVFLWNYRGYGRSTGKPDPQTLRRDGEAIVDYLREDMGIEIIGCHGESIGGLVATHLARWKNLDFLCADRTLESLFQIARVVFGKGLSLFYRVLTGWDDRLVLDFLECKCYKIITFDPKDEVIPFLCSLQHGITSKIVQRRLGIANGEPIKPSEKEDYKIYSPARWILRIKQFIYSIQVERFLNKADEKLKQDNGALQKEQLKAFYKALSRVYDLFEIFSYLKHNSNLKKHRRMVSAGGLPQLSSPVKQNSQIGEHHLNASPTSLQGGDDISVSDFSGIGNTKNEIKLGERISNQSRASQGLPENGIDFKASIAKESYQKFFDQEAQKDTELVIFLENVFTSLEIFELGGVQIETIMTMPEHQRFEAFKHFLNSLDIWGSYLPLHQTLKEEIKNVSYHQTKAIRKIRVLTKRLDHIAKTERMKDQGNLLAPLHKILKDSILEDIELMVSILPILIKNAKFGEEKEHKRYLESSPEQIELMPRSIKEELSQQLLDPQIDLEKKPRKDYSSTVGHLIPLCCGHNGTLRPLEIEIYEVYLKNAGLI